ncbi:putative Ras-related protein Rab-33 [Lingula anatina]|uniref:Ras-related protein Rab-33 n=1 Tax=Lingula anatina TaxID=7574 RepID=A0A1S3JMT9_LINAN|nr:putative Ras-related protein Rab-33 [Lingula anatina]|eukprot:XP_013411254.1 putative Ras-related protein Rab-33 [Lingula anatina]
MSQEDGEAKTEAPRNTSGTTEVFETSTTVIVEKKSQKRIFKIIVIGDSNVGKTCLTYRFCSGKFPEKTEATIGVDFRERTLEIDGESIKLQLWDTAGQERFRKSMVQHYYRNVHAVVFVYDVTKASSFENMPSWVDECDRHHLNTDIPRILVGNKCDMRDKAQIATNVAQKFADSHNMPLFETSAKDDSACDHVDAIFMTLAHKLKNSKPMMSPKLAGMVKNRVINVGKSRDGRRLSQSRESENEKDMCGC